MKKIIGLILATCAALLWTATAAVWAGNSDADAARVPLENYLKAHATGEGEYIRKAFHPDAKIMSYRDGKFQQLTAAEFAARFSGKPAADEAQRKRRIVNLDIVGNTATAKIELDYPNALITDYMALMKIDGEWKIVNKIFYVEPRK